MKLDAIIAALQGCKGSGCWKRIAERSATDYTTIARIARGDIGDPGVLTCERITDALVAEGCAAARDGPPLPVDPTPAAVGQGV